MPVSMKSRGLARATGIDRQAVDRLARVRGDRRSPVDDLAHAVEDAAQEARRESERQRLADEAHDRVGQRKTGRRFEHLDRRELVVERRDAAEARAAVGAAHLDRVAEPGVDASAAGKGAVPRAASPRAQP